MSNVILVCARGDNKNPYSIDDITKISDRLTPDNIRPREPYAANEKEVLLGVFNGHKSNNVFKANTYAGNLLEPSEDWHRIGSAKPDGSYALFRSDADSVELVTDILASRTIWYIKTNALFIASTSQRAIVFFLRSFQPDKRPYSWMLANGTLGPGFSWDKRIQSLLPDSCLTLCRSSWDITISTESPVFKSVDLPVEEHREILKQAMEDTFSAMELNPAEWVLPLSGGYDSRLILMLLKNKKNMRCFTIAPDQTHKKGTGYIAKKLAEFYGLEIELVRRGQLSKDPLSKVFNRYLVAGEGRTDGISGYYDGFDLWKSLHNNNCHGVVRGDEIFGWKPVSSFKDVVDLLGLDFFSDYENLPAPETFGLDKMSWPPHLKPNDGDTPRLWYNKIYQLFRVPYVLSARTDCKSSYVEVINPLLSKKVVIATRRIPDYLQDDKKLFVSIVTELSPNIPFHSSVSPAHDKTFKNLEKGRLVDQISTREGINIIRSELDSKHARRLLSDTLIDFLLDGVRVRETLSKRVLINLKHFIRAAVPATVTSSTQSILFEKKSSKKNIDINKMAFRAYIIVAMYRMLESDASAL